MNTGSLRLRLILAASIAISIALGLAGIASYYKFRERVTQLTVNELNAHFEQLVSKVSFDDEGQLIVDGELSDPRFEKQFGGLYWQIDPPNADPLRSRSLWDQTLNVPLSLNLDDEEQIHELDGPNGTALLSLERILTIEQPDGKPLKALVTVGIDQSATASAAAQFGNDVTSGLGVLYLALMAASFAQILLGLRPLEAIRKGLEAIRSGSEQRMAKPFPSEVQPLVNEINTLLDSREQQLGRARQRAGNLAHGLKTPLTVLEAVASDLDVKGEALASEEIREAVKDMRQLVDRELMRARASADNRYSRSKITPIVKRVIHALRAAPRHQHLNWSNEIAEDAELPMESGDVMEVLGNLLENAQKYATSNIRISSTPISITIEDDGPGVSNEELANIVKRGVKLDEHKAGSGLGLAIVQDMADAYAADLKLDRSPLGGLRVTFAFASKA
jgi:signal transduction histidine kinase